VVRIFSLAIQQGSQFMDQSKSVAGAAGVLLACVFVVSSALAAEPDTRVRTEDISFQDLNLTTTAGVEALYQHIHSAAERVCTNSGQSNLAESASAMCTKDSLARAVKEIDLPALNGICCESLRVTRGPDENERLDPIILRSSMSASAGTHALPVQL